MTDKEDLSRYRVTPDTEFVAEDADLDGNDVRWPDGRRMTEENTADYTKRAVGRPSLSKGVSPQVAFRLSATLRRDAEQLADREGISVSELAREALEAYISEHGAA